MKVSKILVKDKAKVYDFIKSILNQTLYSIILKMNMKP